MQVIKHGFSIKSEVLDISSIKPGGSGSINGKEYPASTKFRTLNLLEEPFEGTQRETEEIVEYQIICSSNKEAEIVTNLLRNLRTKKLPVFVNTSIPKLYPGSQVYTVKSLDLGKEFLNLNRYQEKKEEKKVS
jgi:ABC-type histidine transport system ATPase subunit